MNFFNLAERRFLFSLVQRCLLMEEIHYYFEISSYKLYHPIGAKFENFHLNF